jgi:DNA end-binding protein Ku
MEKSGQIALGRVVIGTRERILALEPRDKGILAYTIRTDAEVRKPDEIFGGISDKAADPAMISIAEKIIEQQEGPFDPSRFVDRYEEALKALIEDKKKGHKPAKVAEPDDTNVVDLMSALRASLGAHAKSAARAEPKSKPKGSRPAQARAKTRKAS